MKLYTGSFGQQTLDKPAQGKPIWNICLYMRRIDGGIQQLQNIYGTVTITP